jgi:hypothetical protein
MQLDAALCRQEEQVGEHGLGGFDSTCRQHYSQPAQSQVSLFVCVAQPAMQYFCQINSLGSGQVRLAQSQHDQAKSAMVSFYSRPFFAKCSLKLTLTLQQRSPASASRPKGGQAFVDP